MTYDTFVPARAHACWHEGALTRKETNIEARDA